MISEINKSEILPIERIFSSKGRTRIIYLLYKYKDLTITQLTSKTGLNHKAVLNHLVDLCAVGIVQEKRYGRIRIFGFNTTSKLTLLIMNFLRSWEYETLLKSQGEDNVK